MRVAVDGRALRPGGSLQRGVARYVRCLLEVLAQVGPDDEYVLLVAGADDPVPFSAPNVRTARSRVPGRVLFGAAAVIGRPRLDRLAGGCDVVWAPAPAPMALSSGVPLVLTLHDLSFEHAGDYTRYERLWHRLAQPQRLARKATRVICHSETVRETALARWGLDPEAVRVVRSGAGKPRGAACTGQPGTAGEGTPDVIAALPEELTQPYVLAVGALEPRKRPGLLVEAHALARSRGLRAALVFAGDGPLRDELKRSHAIVLGHVPDPTLDALYGRALALVCVSRDEGFGYTPVEALARGTPTVVADLPVFAETLGEGALRVPPGDAEALAGALLRLEADEGLRRRLVAAGQEAVAELSWGKAARQTRAILVEAAS